jgi:hypothetical protein
MANNFPAIDIGKVMAGNNGALYDGAGNLLASIEGFSSKATVENAQFQPLGSAMKRSRMTAYSMSLTFTEIVVRDDLFFVKIAEGLRTGNFEPMVFRGDVTSPYDDSTESILYTGCVPDGDIDIQNMAVGELYKRVWNFIVNNPPELLSTLDNS